ncbi:MAG: phage virion morphogenesis protein [Proteobacteria bacterium]|nr:phage virion morphogenesis protein [Pseudomonadota bacterium]MBU1058460.1 phage virion morphogenesis protein [Pseudomonadota bacterium]
MRVEIDDARLQEILARSIERCENKQQALKAVGAIVRESIRTNFREGGRPEKWQPSRRSSAESIPGRRIGTLRDTNRLMNSFTIRADQNSVVVGTNVEYAATHQYGARKFSFGTVVAKVPAHYRTFKGKFKIQVKAHSRKMKLPWGDIPARPFMHIQTDDIRDIEEILAAHIIGGTT